MQTHVAVEGRRVFETPLTNVAFNRTAGNASIGRGRISSGRGRRVRRCRRLTRRLIRVAIVGRRRRRRRPFDLVIGLLRFGRGRPGSRVMRRLGGFVLDKLLLFLHQPVLLLRLPHYFLDEFQLLGRQSVVIGCRAGIRRHFLRIAIILGRRGSCGGLAILLHFRPLRLLR